VTPSGRDTTHIHAVRLRPGRGELYARDDVWVELERRGASIARVPFSGRAGQGGRTERIELPRLDGAGLAEVELWSSRDAL
jgi:hypothetical protein